MVLPVFDLVYLTAHPLVCKCGSNLSLVVLGPVSILTTPICSRVYCLGWEREAFREGDPRRRTQPWPKPLLLQRCMNLTLPVWHPL